MAMRSADLISKTSVTLLEILYSPYFKTAHWSERERERETIETMTTAYATV